VPADRRLRELDDAAQLGHGQLAAIEQQQHAAARRVRQRGEMIVDCSGASIHPYSRM
jgi:hypothetical protein